MNRIVHLTTTQEYQRALLLSIAPTATRTPMDLILKRAARVIKGRVPYEGEASNARLTAALIGMAPDVVAFTRTPTGATLIESRRWAEAHRAGVAAVRGCIGAAHASAARVTPLRIVAGVMACTRGLTRHPAYARAVVEGMIRDGHLAISAGAMILTSAGDETGAAARLIDERFDGRGEVAA